MNKEMEFARRLYADGKGREALAVFLAIYDVATNADNYGRADRDGVYSRDTDKLGVTLGSFIREAATWVSRMYLYELERKDKELGWWSKVQKDVDELLKSGVPEGMEKVRLVLYKASEWRIRPEGSSGREWEESYEAMTEYVEEYLKRDDLTPEERWAATYHMANYDQNNERLEKALAMFEGLERIQRRS